MTVTKAKLTGFYYSYTNFQKSDAINEHMAGVAKHKSGRYYNMRLVTEDDTA